MVGETTNETHIRSPLLPDRRQQKDFFVCDIFDAMPKGDMASMEHPIFSISTKPDQRIRRYENGSNFIEVTPSVKGLATVHDRDVLIFCISQIMAALNQGQKVNQTVRFKAYDLLTATNRRTGGDSYLRLRDALERLRGTSITTNIRGDGQEQLDGFGLIESFKVVRETREGRMQEVEIKLSDWVFDAIRHNEVLTIDRDYFRLRKPLERRIYELARKHCGNKREWKISLGLLQKKCGSNSTLKEFRRLVRNIVQQDDVHQHMPGYAVLLGEADFVLFVRRKPELEEVSEGQDFHLSPDTYEQARQLAPGWDVYHLELEWRDWITEAPRNADAAFLGFCRKWFEKRGRP